MASKKRKVVIGNVCQCCTTKCHDCRARFLGVGSYLSFNTVQDYKTKQEVRLCDDCCYDD